MIDTFIIILALIGAVVIIALFFGFGSYLYGRKIKENEIAKANLHAIETAQQTAKTIQDKQNEINNGIYNFNNDPDGLL